MKSCENIDDPVAYGTPHATFSVKGRVTDTQGNPVRGIKVEIPVIENVNYSGYEEPYSTITDRSGDYHIAVELFSPNTFDADVSATDIDGAENGGVFEAQIQKVSVRKDDFTGGEGWDAGTANKTVDFTLEAEEPQE